MTVGRIPSVEGGIQPTIVDAKGDLIAATGNDSPNRLAVGANDTVLTADSTAATGLKWAAIPPGGGITLISETTASGLTSLSLSSIPQTYKHLQLVWQGITQSSGSRYGLRLNNNSTSIYYEARMGGTDTSFNGVTIGATNQVESSSTIFGDSLSSTASWTLRGTMTIYNYSSTTMQKSLDAEWSWKGSGEGKTFNILKTVFATTTAVTSIDVFRDFGTGTFSNAANTSIRLYGIS